MKNASPRGDRDCIIRPRWCEDTRRAQIAMVGAVQRLCTEGAPLVLFDQGGQRRPEGVIAKRFFSPSITVTWRHRTGAPLFFFFGRAPREMPRCHADDKDIGVCCCSMCAPLFRCSGFRLGAVSRPKAVRI